MSGGEVDHEVYHSVQYSSDNQCSEHSRTASSTSIPLLPASVYTVPNPVAPRRPSISTSFASRSSNKRHELENGDLGEEASPDPHEFYKPYRDPFDRDVPGQFLGQGDALPAGLTGSTAAGFHPRKTSISSVLSNGTTTSPPSLPTRRYQREYRSASTTSNKSLAAEHAGSQTGGFPTPAKSRQSSLRDLVNKFNQIPDEVPPVPRSSSSRVTSRATSPAGSLNGNSGVRARSSSRTTRGLERGRSEQSVHTLQKQPSGKRDPSVVAVRQQRPPTSAPQQQEYYPADSPAARSLVDLGGTNRLTNRAPLFGELLPVNTAVGSVGYGIPSQHRRRGSEGSLQSPSPVFVDGFDPGSGLSPSSPTAWYLGYTSSLEAVNSGHHRRTRSEFPGNLSRPAVASSLSTHMAIAPSLAEPAMPASLDQSASKSPLQSRIPIFSSRRLSHDSCSSNSSPSTRTNSALGRYHTPQIPLPPKGTTAIPKPSRRPQSPARIRAPLTIASPGRPQSPVRPRAPLTIASPGRHDRGHIPQSQKSPSLKAFIAAPPPKESPPLRSSRPRQPVSMATTSASRAKVVDRVSTLQTRVNPTRELKSPRSSRPKRLPEMSNVDFAARRQKIQQAFNKTVQENEKKEEVAAVQRRKLAKEKEEQARKEKAAKEEEQKQQRDSAPPQAADLVEGSTSQDHISADSEERTAPTDEGPVLKLDSAPQPNDAAAAADDTTRLPGAWPTGDDSPTLGTYPEVASERPEIPTIQSPLVEVPPNSAVTWEPADRAMPFGFHAEQSQSNWNHRTVLSQIMQMRESSQSSVASSDDEDMSFSENGHDDKESIDIIMRRSGYLDDSVDNSSETQEDFENVDGLQSEGHHRWSMSSWNSSHQDQQSTASHLETDHRPLTPEETSRTPQPLPPMKLASPGAATSMGDVSKSDGQHPFSTSGHGSEMPDPHHFLPIAPNLAKQGGWNSKRVTQLYLQELARGRVNRPLPSSQHNHQPEAERPPSAVGEGRQKDGLSEEPVVVSKPEGLSKSGSVVHRASASASLNRREDWEHASPSIVDWMHFAAADTPEAELSDTLEKPSSTNALAPAREDTQTPRVQAADSHNNTVPVSREGLGLSIHIQPPQGQESVVHPAYPDHSLPQGQEPVVHPPYPDHSPPPPPGPALTVSELDGPRLNEAPSPSIYSANPPSSILPSVPVIPSEYRSTGRSSEESSLRHVGYTPSPPTLASTPSLGRSSTDQISLETSAKAGSPSPEQRRLKKRRNVIKELVDTEYTFGHDMKVVEDIYKGTSSSCLDLSAEDVKILFCNSDQIVQFSMTFHDNLKKAAKSVYVMPKSARWNSKRGSRTSTLASSATTDDQSSIFTPDVSDIERDRRTYIGEAFMASIEKMEKVYADYLKNHDAANKKLEALQKNDKVAIWLRECRQWAADLTSAWNLDSLLVKPVQRILKYPLLLTELLDATPKDHPDYPAIATALAELTNISVRINDMKKRADLVGQVVSSRKRKDSDVRTGFSKAFGRRTEKLRQQVGLSDMFEDKEYDSLSQRFGDSFFQVQVVMRDIELYTKEMSGSFDRFSDYVLAIEGMIDVGPTSFPEMESKWRRFRMSVQEVLTVALPDHLALVRKSVIDPIVTLLKLHDGPQKVMQKRNKRLMDFARFKAIKDRGDKPDKKTIEQGEQFVALNVTLKEELPQLFSLTAKLMEACLHSFVQLQSTWHRMLHQKLGYTIENLPKEILQLTELRQVADDWAADFAFREAQVLALGICNGSMLADSVNMVNFTTPTDPASPRRPSTVNSSNNRSMSLTASPKISTDFSMANSGMFNSPKAESSFAPGRSRTNSNLSGRGVAPEFTSGQLLQSVTAPQLSTRSINGASRAFEASPSLPRLSLDTPLLDEVLNESALSGAYRSNEESERPPNEDGRYSGFFSSAMPMSDSPRPESPRRTASRSKDPNVLFLAASIYEFNIDRARREAGYPYLTYVSGEIFDVIAEKGELWLARNQDDPTHQVGWIWNKHFAKLAT